jgi:hypothetical protein
MTCILLEKLSLEIDSQFGTTQLDNISTSYVSQQCGRGWLLHSASRTPSKRSIVTHHAPITEEINQFKLEVR